MVIAVNRERTGRPDVEIDKVEFERLCHIQCTEEEIAYMFNCNAQTIRRFCMKEYKQEFCKVYKRLSGNGRASLRRRMFKSMEEGNVVTAIFLAKNLLGYTDNPKEIKELKDAVAQLTIQYNEKKPDAKN